MDAAFNIQRPFTLDTNCLIAIDEGRPEAAAIRKLTPLAKPMLRLLLCLRRKGKKAGITSKISQNFVIA
jgi:hypothetical protein